MPTKKKPSLRGLAAYKPPLRRLFLDIETSPNVVYSWRVGYKIALNSENIITERAIICIGYKWQGEPVQYLTWHNGDDAAMLRRFVPVLESADEVVAHFGDKDRKSTRLNSSHTVISYAVFCLKKKKKEIYSNANYDQKEHETSKRQERAGARG